MAGFGRELLASALAGTDPAEQPLRHVAELFLVGGVDRFHPLAGFAGDQIAADQQAAWMSDELSWRLEFSLRTRSIFTTVWRLIEALRGGAAKSLC